MRRTRWSCLVAFLLLAACGAREEKQVDLSSRAPRSPSPALPSDTLRIAVGGMITPKEGYAYYKEFLDYVGERIGRSVAYVDAADYRALNEGLRDGTVDAAFVCSGPYVDGKQGFGLELVAVPRAYGGNVYYSYTIVPKGSRADSLAALRGKSFAFTDPLSNSGYLVPAYLLSKMGETPERFFGKAVFTGSHDKAIRAVAEGLVDGASVDSLIWEYQDRTNPVDTGRTRIILKSEPCGIPPFVARPGLDRETKERLRGILLASHDDPKGAAILAKMRIDRFDPPDDRLYDSVRAMKRRVAQGVAGRK